MDVDEHERERLEGFFKSRIIRRIRNKESSLRWAERIGRERVFFFGLDAEKKSKIRL